jgi:hypothetical protein
MCKVFSGEIASVDGVFVVLEGRGGLDRIFSEGSEAGWLAQDNALETPISKRERSGAPGLEQERSL